MTLIVKVKVLGDFRGVVFVCFFKVLVHDNVAICSHLIIYLDINRYVYKRGRERKKEIKGPRAAPPPGKSTRSQRPVNNNNNNKKRCNQIDSI